MKSMVKFTVYLYSSAVRFLLVCYGIAMMSLKFNLRRANINKQAAQLKNTQAALVKIGLLPL